MTQTLEQILLDPARRPAVVTDLEALVDTEASLKSGVSGAVLKTGYAAAKKLLSVADALPQLGRLIDKHAATV